MLPSALATRPTSPDALAREFVASYFKGLRREDLAVLVIDGNAKDFPELAVAMDLLKSHSQTLYRYEAALSQYADASFWDEDVPGGALATHDAGEMARNVLRDRPPFFHRD